MCAPVIPLLTAIGGIASAGSALGIFGNRGRDNVKPANFKPAPALKTPGPAATAAEDPERLKGEEDVAKITQNLKQKKDKLTAMRGLEGLGVAPAINNPIPTPPSGVNIG